MSPINLQNLERKPEFFLLTLETHRRATKQPPANLGAFARTSPVAASFVHILLLVLIRCAYIFLSFAITVVEVLSFLPSFLLPSPQVNMGGDGGSFSHRTEMVRTKGFKFLRNLGGMGYTPNTQIREGDERLGKNESRDLRSSACAYSQVFKPTRFNSLPMFHVELYIVGYFLNVYAQTGENF